MNAPFASIADLRREAEICRIKATSMRGKQIAAPHVVQPILLGFALANEHSAIALDAAADALAREAQDANASR